MSARTTKYPKNPVPARKVHQQTGIVGKNGLQIDAQATLEPGSVLTSSNSTTLTYTSPTITFDPSVDLSSLLNLVKTAQHTGVILLTDEDSNSYFVNPSTIDNTTKTVDIYIDPDYTNPPSNIGLGSGWALSEAALINRLQTTTTAVVDNIEFRDVSINVDLDGSTINVKDDDGDQLEINDDGSINQIMLNRLIDVEHDDIEILAKNDDGDPTNIAIRFEGSLVRTLTITYDADGDLQRVQRS